MPGDMERTPYSPEWPAHFADLAVRLRMALGPLALRIDHVGSTAIPGLSAKPVIDVQISVDSFDGIEAMEKAMNSVGFVYRGDNSDKTQRFFTELPGGRRTHIHIRQAGSFQEVFTLLFRDYLRCHAEDAKAYEENKYELTKTYFDDRASYVSGKGQMIWGIISRAEKWSQETGWNPSPSDY